MGTYWLGNLAGFRLDDKHMEIVPVPRTELTIHVTYKTTQAFSFLGMALVGPISAAVRGNTDKDSMIQSAISCGKNGAMIGACVGPALVLAFQRGKSTDGIRDRAYRLRMNRNQVRVDRLSTLGVLTGAGAAVCMGQDWTSGAVLGLNGGMLLGAFYNSMFGKK